VSFFSLCLTPQRCFRTFCTWPESHGLSLDFLYVAREPRVVSGLFIRGRKATELLPTTTYTLTITKTQMSGRILHNTRIRIRMQVTQGSFYITTTSIRIPLFRFPGQPSKLGSETSGSLPYVTKGSVYRIDHSRTSLKRGQERREGL
jgi:hypothetical protein